MKIAMFSDIHTDAVTAGVRRTADIAMAIDHVVESIIAMKVDVCIFGGDHCNPDSGSITFECTRLLIAAFDRILDEGNTMCFAIAGNHDVINDGSGCTTLGPLNALHSNRMRVVEQPMVYELCEDGRWVRFVFFPYTSPSHSYDPAQFARKIVDGETIADHVVVVGHLMVRGMQPGEETLDMPRGRDIWLPDQEILDARGGKPMTCMNGHYHRGGTHETPSGLKVHIPGSLARLRFGPEEDIEPSYLLVEV